MNLYQNFSFAFLRNSIQYYTFYYTKAKVIFQEILYYKYVTKNITTSQQAY